MNHKSPHPLLSRRALLPALVTLTVVASQGVFSSRVTAATTAIAGRSVVTPGSPIKHVVYIVEENHSFDNTLGAWCVKTGRCDGAVIGTLSNGNVIPLTAASDVVVNVGHSTSNQVSAIDGGKMDGYDLIPGCTRQQKYACYTQYQPSKIPNITAFANTFAVSDRTFEDGPMPSWGMHISAVATNLDGFTGTIPQPGDKGVLGAGWGCNSGDNTPWVSPQGVTSLVPSCVPDHSLDPVLYPYGGAYKATPVRHIPTIMDELGTAGLSWRIYAGLGGNDNSNGYGWSICPTFADCIYTPQSENLVANSQVIADARNGTLPSFSVVTPTQQQSQHNFDSMAAGDNWLGQVVGSIQNGPDWSSTSVFITWDDCGCFYDHVSPPAGFGTRIPMIIVSPYALAGSTDSKDASYASVLAFTEHAFGLPAMTSLDRTAYDYAGSFNFTQRVLKPTPVVVSKISPAEQKQLQVSPPDPTDPT